MGGREKKEKKKEQSFRVFIEICFGKLLREGVIIEHEKSSYTIKILPYLINFIRNMPDLLQIY